MDGDKKDSSQQPTVAYPVPASASPSGAAAEDEKWGTKFMGPPAEPSSHPANQKAALWGAPNQPYVLEYKPVERHGSPMETILDYFNDWGRRAETLAHNIWHNLKTGHSVSEAAWGKLSLTAKAMTEGGFEALYKQTFGMEAGERLKRTFACYLSTSAGPVAGTLYLSSHNAAFCSDRPLNFTAPSGQQAWSYYKVVLPLARVASVMPVTLKENPPERYIQITTVDGHDFWFMGFVNYEKAIGHLQDSLAEFAARQRQLQLQPPQVVAA